MSRYNVIFKCYCCDHVVSEDELPTYRQGHRIGNVTFYENERLIFDCPACRSSNSLGDAFECADCGEVFLKEDAGDYTKAGYICKGCCEKSIDEEAS